MLDDWSWHSNNHLDFANWIQWVVADDSFMDTAMELWKSCVNSAEKPTTGPTGGLEHTNDSLLP